MALTLDEALTCWYKAFDLRDGMAELTGIIQREFSGAACHGLQTDLGNGLGAGLRVSLDDGLSDIDYVTTKNDIENRLAALLPQPMQGLPILVQRTKDVPQIDLGIYGVL